MNVQSGGRSMKTDFREGDPAANISSGNVDRVARRVADLLANDAQFRGAEPKPLVVAAARRPGLRLALALHTLVEGYADRPALGQRARELAVEAGTGRTVARLLPRFE